MTKRIFAVDGSAYNVYVPEEGITRNFEIADTDNAGRAVTGEMIRDIIGTYYNYTIEIYGFPNDMDSYYTLYNVLSSPIDYHLLHVPYNGGVLNFKAYVTNGQDKLKTMKNGNKWKGLSVNFIAMKPQWRHDGTLTGYTRE